MRITGGEWSGRRIEDVPAEIRPTQDKVRLAIFSSLGERVHGARVLDLFAGTGALGLEALSRGAAFACWVERNARAADLLRRRVSEWCPDRGLVVRADVFAWLTKPFQGKPFDLVLADPPYGERGRGERYSDLLNAVSASSSVAADALFVLEMRTSQVAIGAAGWEPVWDRTYGDTRVVMFRRKGHCDE